MMVTSGLRPVPLKTWGVLPSLVNTFTVLPGILSRESTPAVSPGPVQKIDLAMMDPKKYFKSKRLGNSSKFPGTTCATNTFSPKSHSSSTAPCECWVLSSNLLNFIRRTLESQRRSLPLTSAWSLRALRPISDFAQPCPVPHNLGDGTIRDLLRPTGRFLLPHSVPVSDISTFPPSPVSPSVIRGLRGRRQLPATPDPWNSLHATVISRCLDALLWTVLTEMINFSTSIAPSPPANLARSGFGALFWWSTCCSSIGVRASSVPDCAFLRPWPSWSVSRAPTMASIPNSSPVLHPNSAWSWFSSSILSSNSSKSKVPWDHRPGGQPGNIKLPVPAGCRHDRCPIPGPKSASTKNNVPSGFWRKSTHSDWRRVNTSLDRPVKASVVSFFHDFQPKRFLHSFSRTVRCHFVRSISTQERFMWDNYQNSIAEDEGELGKVGVEMSFIQSQMHPDCDSAESIACRLGSWRWRSTKILASPLYIQERGDHESSRKPSASGKPEAVIIQKRGASAQRTHAVHSRRERMKSTSS